MAEREVGLKSLLMRVKEESEKAGLKLHTQKMKIMASGPITLWQIDRGKKWKQWQTVFSWAPKSLWMLTAAMKLKDACSLEKSYDKTRQHIKNRDITSLTKVSTVKAMVCPVVMYSCESQTIRKTKRQRIDAFKLWC